MKRLSKEPTHMHAPQIGVRAQCYKSHSTLAASQGMSQHYDAQLALVSLDLLLANAKDEASNNEALAKSRLRFWTSHLLH